MEGLPAGGVLVWGTEGQVLIDVGQEGWLKRLQPRFFNLSSHWIRNVGVKPYKIRLDMDLCDFELEWETPEANWDQATQSSTRTSSPGKLQHGLVLPHSDRSHARERGLPGQLEVLDAETGESLSVLPITILNSRGQQ